MMSNEIKKCKSGHSLITWGLYVVIIVVLQTISVDAAKEKTLDVIPVGGSDEFYDRDYVPPPRPPPRASPPRPRPPPPPPPPPPPVYERPPPQSIHNWGGGSDEYHRQRKWENWKRPSYEEVRKNEAQKPGFVDVSKQTPNKDAPGPHLPLQLAP